MSKHTPGPWKYNANGEVFSPDGTDGDDTLICVVGASSGFRSHAYNRIGGKAVADHARLIAAAPDLLASLRDMVRYDDLPPAEQQPAVERARAAIAKAEGR